MKENKYIRRLSSQNNHLVDNLMFGVKIKYNTNYISYSQILSESIECSKIDCEILDKVICLIGQQDYMVYHYVIEYLGELVNLGNIDLADFKILISSRCYMFKLEWLYTTFPNLNEDQIILVDGGKELYCKNLLVVGRFLGLTQPLHKSHEKIESMNKLILKNMNFSNNLQNKMLLIKRNHKRILKNWDGVYEVCNNFCKNKNIELDIFDDSENLGSVKEQLRRFNSAKVIVGCHGAGFTNILGCNSNTEFIEFSLQDRGKSKMKDVRCYEWIANFLDINYYKILKYEKTGIDLNNLTNLLSGLKNV